MFRKFSCLLSQQHRFQLGPRQQADVTAPHIQPQAAIDLVEGELDRRWADRQRRHRSSVRASATPIYPDWNWNLTPAVSPDHDSGTTLMNIGP